MIVVEVLGRRGEVQQRVRLMALPATIGRAWTSDVVIGDPTVDAAHARIVADESGALAIEDLGSLNGLHAGASRTRVPRIALDGVTAVRVGRTALRIARADQPVPAAVPDLTPAGRLAWLLESPRSMLGVMVLGLLLVGVEAWLDSYEKGAAAAVAGEVVLVASVMALWAGIWAMVGRIRVHQFSFPQHLALVFLATIVLDVPVLALTLLEFLFPSDGLFDGLAVVAGCAAAIALISAHLYLVGTSSRRRRVAVASLVVALLTGLVLVTGEAATSEFSTPSVTIHAPMAPLPAGLIPGGDVATFVRSTDGLRTELERRAKRRP